MGILDYQTVVLATLGASLILFVTDALRYDAVAILVVLVLAGTGALGTEEAFAGFASPAVVLVASMYAFAASVSRNGITQQLCKRLFGERASSEGFLVFRIFLVTGLMSSVLSNAAVVATMIPVLGTISRNSEIPASRLLMPMAFGSLLGGMLTVIGTSKNIAVNGVIENYAAAHPTENIEPFALFDFTPYGLVLLIIGALYFLGPGRYLLPRSRVKETLSDRYQVPKFLTEVMVEPGSTLINRAVSEIGLLDRYGITLLGIVRQKGEKVLAPGPYNRIRGDDLLMLQGEPEAILKMRRDMKLRERASVDVGDTRLESSDVQLVEAVVPATSSLVGHTLQEADFQANTNLNVLALSKHGDVKPTQIRATRIEIGDTLLIQGHRRDLERVTTMRELIVMDEYQPREFGRPALVTVLLLVGVLLTAALTSLNISVAALAGAVGLVLLGCVRADDVRRSIDWSVLILIGGMLALGKAFSKHGLDTQVAEWMQSAGASVDHPLFVVGMIFVTTLLLTQVINHVAAAVIMTPVALTLATQLGINDRALLMAVLTGAEFAFMSPVAHQANAMVMGPGDYRYRDFLRTGTPLTVLLVIVAILLIPLFWAL